MNDQTTELIHWLTLAHAQNVGFAHLKKLLAHFHSVEAICKATENALQQGQLNAAQIRAIKHPNKKWIETALRWQEHPHHHVILYNDARYPRLLTEIASPPLILYVHGDCELLSRSQIAMVGSRNPSHTGIDLATEFAALLTQVGFVVTSGLAIGIDGACHQGALAAGGKTIAVLGNGLQQIYPKRHISLAEKIAANGCLVSELPLDMAPTRENFPRRNRIISGLSLGTLVVEAALKSGSLITARYALEQNREVFSIPGSLRNPTAQGCHTLIKQGAKCVTCVNDILEEFGIDAACNPINPPPSSPRQVLDCTDQLVLACIEYEVATIDQICARSKLSVQTVTAALLDLELNGKVNGHFGGYVKVGM